MKLTKTPFNWVGNKFKYLEIINDLVENKEYEYVIDMFMGSGNILLNIDVKANTFIGNDKIKLLPCIYNEIIKNQYTYSLNDIEREF